MNKNCVWCGGGLHPESSVRFTFWDEWYLYHNKPFPNDGRELVHNPCLDPYLNFMGNV